MQTQRPTSSESAAASNTITEDFSRVIQLAEAHDENGLKEYVESGHCLDIQRGYYAPSTLLAEQGKDSAVSLLEKLGANSNLAGRGYAMGGNEAKVQEYLEKGVPAEQLLIGAALNNQLSLINFLLQHEANVLYAIEALTFGNHHDTATRLCESATHLSKEEKNLRRIYGHAYLGNDGMVKALISRAGDKAAAVQEAAYGYAWARNLDKAIPLFLKNEGSEIDTPVLAQVIESLASVGALEEIKHLMEKYTNEINGADFREKAISRFAFYGNVEAVKALRVSDRPSPAELIGYGLGRHFWLMEDAVKRTLRPEWGVKYIIQGLIDGEHVRSQAKQMELLTHLQDTNIRRIFTNEMQRALRKVGKDSYERAPAGAAYSSGRLFASEINTGAAAVTQGSNRSTMNTKGRTE